MRTQVAVALTVALAFPAAAAANDFQNVYREYKRTGTIKPCRFSDKQLTNAERQTPPDVEQYAPSFLDALQNARERNADCGRKPAAAPAPTSTSTTPSAAPPTASTPTPAPAATPTTASTATTTPTTTPAPPPPSQAAVANVPSPPINAAKKDDSAPAAVWLLAALVALVLLSALFAGLAWWFGWGPALTTGGSGASWGDFGDWIREGW